MNQREYRTLILAGLLHDVGKLLNKPDPHGKKHAVYSLDLLQSSPYADLFQERFSDDIDLDLLCYLVLRHDPYVKKDKHLPQYKGPWDLPQHESLLNRIRRADGLSAIAEGLFWHFSPDTWGLGRDLELFSLEEAVHRMTSFPAERRPAGRGPHRREVVDRLGAP